MRKASKRYVILALLMGCWSVAGVAAKKPKPPVVPPDPRFAMIDTVTLLPIVDLRSGKKEGVNLVNLRATASKVLKGKGYAFALADNTGEAGEIAEEDLPEPKPGWLKRLGPPTARWVMVLCLGDVESKITFGSVGNAQMSGYLYDKEKAELVWKGKGVGQAGQGGLAGMMFKGMVKGEALNAAVYNLLSTIPKRPKAPK